MCLVHWKAETLAGFDVVAKDFVELAAKMERMKS
jgi:hypothetical protein